MQFRQNLISTNRKPRLRTYLSLTRYLNEYFAYRRSKDPTFSYEFWAEELGFKSKASVRMICQGKRNITENFLHAFAKYEKLDTEDLDFLQLLNFHQKVRSPSLKQCFLEKILEKFDITSSQKDIRNHVLYLSSRMTPVLHLLISFEDFEATEKNIKNVLNLDSKTLAQHLGILKDLDLIRRANNLTNDECCWVSNAKMFKIPGEISDPAIALFHEQSMLEAQEKLKQFSKYNQFRTLYFSLDEAAFNDFYETMQNMANGLKAKYCNDHIANKRLFKFNFQIFPVTDLIKPRKDETSSPQIDPQLNETSSNSTSRSPLTL